MTDDKIIEQLLIKANDCYKKQLRKRCPGLSRALDRHEEIELLGEKITCWRELIVLTCGNIINDFCPDAEVEVNLDGNDSSLLVKVMSFEDEKVLQNRIKDMVV